MQDSAVCSNSVRGQQKSCSEQGPSLPSNASKGTFLDGMGGLREGSVKPLFDLKLDFHGKLWINLGYHIYPKYSHPLLFTQTWVNSLSEYLGKLGKVVMVVFYCSGYPNKSLNLIVYVKLLIKPANIFIYF